MIKILIILKKNLRLLTPNRAIQIPTPRGGDWVIPGARAIEAF